MFGLNEVPDLSSDDAALKRFVTREPISIFSQIKNVKDEEKKEKLNRLLEALRKKLPEGFKIGAAVGEGDCFFDSVAQGLNELKDKGLITSSRGFSVKSLRESCKQYAQQVSQSKKSSWLDNALKGEGEKLCEYIPRIEFTAEDIEGANSDSEIKVLKLENAIWGRSEIEGKMICEKYSVKIRIIELRDEEIDGVHVTKGKVGTGNNIIYIVNYRNHFVPLLSSLEKDIEKTIEVSREEAYGNAIGSSSNNISQSYISIPLRDIENSSHKQSSHSRSSGKENCEIGVSSRRRKRSVTDKDSKVPKRAHIDINVTSNEDLEFPSDLQDKSKQDGLNNAYQTNRCVPNQLIGLMYQLDLSVLCLLRESVYKHKYPSLSLVFEGSEIDKFSSVVLHYKKKSIHIKIENVDKYYIDNDIGYARLFIKEKRSSYIDNCFNSFVEHLIFKSDNLSNNIEYLIIYTNSCLDLTEEKELKQRRSGNFYPLKFDSMNIEECGILKDFLFTNDNIQGRSFYQFSQNKTTRRELLKRLEFSPAMQKVIKERKFFQECEREIKEMFLDKLVFAVNQPNREELNSIVKGEIEKNSEDQGDYVALQVRILRDLTTTEKHKKLGNYVPKIIYGFNLLMSFLHSMFLHKNIFSINFEEKSYGIPNDIIINYKGRIAYVKAHTINSSIGYSQLFPQKKQKSTFSINKHFACFAEGLKNDVRYFIIYTNVDLDLTEEKELKQGRLRSFYPLKFDSIDIQKKRYEILRDCSFIDKDGLYQFAQEKETREKLLSLLKLPPSLQEAKKEGNFSNEKEIKEKFLDKLIFATNQKDKKDKIDKSNVPYNYEELHEIALRWLESYEFGSITKEIMKRLYEDIKGNKLSCQKIQNKSISEEIKFAKSVVGREGTSAFDQFLDFLIKGEGKKYLEVLKGNGVKLTSMSSILDRARTNAEKAFKELYNLWFDEKGNKTQYLKTIEEEINLTNISSILSGAGSNAAKAFKDLYDLWFDKQGNKTQYLKTLEKEGINLSNISSILSRAGSNAVKAFKDLYDLWFDEQGNKAQYLKTLEKEGINLSNISSILSRAGSNAAKAFKDLYDLWFDEQGNKTQYLKTLEKEGINLSNISSILNGARTNAAKVFKELYNLWFNEKGSKTQYLKTLEKEGINLSNMSSILSRAGSNAAKAFKDLYDLWFDEQGSKTQYLKTLEKEGISISNMSNILSGAGSSATKAFKGLYNLWFDEQENRTQYLKTLEGEGINLTNISGILSGAGSNAAKAFKDLYDFWFDKQGNKTQYLKTLEEKEISLTNISGILSKAGSNAAKAFKDLYDLWFDKQGNKTQYLKTLEKEEIDLSNMSSILHGVGSNAAKAFKDLYDFWFDKQGNKTQYLKTLEKEEIDLSNMSSILHGVGSNAAKAFKELYDLWFDEEGNKTQYLKTLEKEEIDLSNMSSILHGVGSNAAKAFKELYDLWFDEEGNKTQYLKTLEKEEIDLSNISSILNGAGSSATKAFKELYNVFFDGQGNKAPYLETLEENGINLINVSSMLSGVGSNALKAFKGLYNTFCDEQGNKKQHLKHFIKKRGFTIHNLSGILNGAGVNTQYAFKELHNVCFNDKGKITKLLDDFYNADFEPGNLSCMLCGAGARASSILKRLHSVCFDDEGKRTELLNDFYNADFGPGDLCSILSGAADSLQEFHSFCFIGETKKYLYHFLDEEESFTLSNVCNILHGARANICSALKDFHNVCFDEAGNKTRLLDDFHRTGFTTNNLSKILSMAGNNAASILRSFHKSCFNKENYLNHFLAEKKLFTPKGLSKILRGVGTKICTTFEKLHNLCFDKAGNKTDYLDNLIESNLPNKVINILYKKVRKTPSTFLDDISFQQQDIEESEMEEIDDPSTSYSDKKQFRIEKSEVRKGSSQINDQRLPIVKLCDLSSKVKEELQKKRSANYLTVLNETENNPLKGRDNENLEEQKSADLSSQKNRAFTSQQQSNSLGKRKLESSTEKRKESTAQNYSKKKKANTEVSLECSDEERQEVFSRLLEFVSSNFPNASIKSVRQGLHLSSFEKYGTRVNGKCVAITRSLSQALFLHSKKSVLNNLETSAEIYERIVQGKQVSEKEKGEIYDLEDLIYSFEEQLDSYINSSLPSSLVYNTKKDHKTLSNLSSYIAEIKGDFAIHLVTSNHVIATYKIGDNYAYFDSNAAFVSGLKSVDQLIKVVEKAVEFADYRAEERGFLIEHFDVDKANNLLSDKDRQVLTKEIKTKRQLLAEQDKEFGLIKINDQELSRVQLYDFGTKTNVEGGVPLLINADMNLNSKKFQDHLDKKEVSMTAREYLDSLKNSKNTEKVVRATRLIPFEGSKREIEKAEQTREPKRPLLEQLVKGAINFIASNLTTAFFTDVSRLESQLPGKTDNKPETYLNDSTVDNQLQKSL